MNHAIQNVVVQDEVPCSLIDLLFLIDLVVFCMNNQMYRELLFFFNVHPPLRPRFPSGPGTPCGPGSPSRPGIPDKTTYFFYDKHTF